MQFFVKEKSFHANKRFLEEFATKFVICVLYHNNLTCLISDLFEIKNKNQFH